MPPKISIVIPVYNEAGCIGKVVKNTRDLFPDDEIIVVDDGSTDESVSEAKQAGALVYSHPYNIGNGAAVKTGIRMASGEVLVFMDGDNQHDPRDIKKLMAFIPEHDMVVGMRRKSDQASLFRFSGNLFFNWLASYVAKFPVKDLTSGFRAIKAKTAKNFINMLPNSYSYPTTITLGVLRSGLSVKYIPISINRRSSGKSHLKVAKDGVRFFMIIVKICTLYSPMRVFLPVSFIMFVLGLCRYAYTYITQNAFTNMSAFLFVGGLMIFMMGLISEQICQMRYEKTENLSDLK